MDELAEDPAPWRTGSSTRQAPRARKTIRARYRMRTGARATRAEELGDPTGAAIGTRE
jgi:hypothetical protein